MKFVDLFKQVARKMDSDFERTRIALTQPGLKGTSFEEIFRLFLRDYLPKSLDISTGILIDSRDNQSRQLDVIISDTATGEHHPGNHCLYFAIRGYAVVP